MNISVPGEFQLRAVGQRFKLGCVSEMDVRTILIRGSVFTSDLYVACTECRVWIGARRRSDDSEHILQMAEKLIREAKRLKS